jgi:hypothetical protein
VCSETEEILQCRFFVYRVSNYMERRIRYGIILLSCLIVTLCVYGIVFQSRASNRVFASVDFAMAAVELSTAFDRDEALSDSLYLYKVLAVTGRVQKVQKDKTGSYSVTLGASQPAEAGGASQPGEAEGASQPGEAAEKTVVDCRLDGQFNQEYATLQPGDSLRLLGICAGRLQNVILVQCIIEK